MSEIETEIEVGTQRSVCEIPIYLNEHEKSRIHYKPILRTMVSSYYDLMKIRIAIGNRLTSMIFRRLGFNPGEKIYDQDPNDVEINYKDLQEELIRLGFYNIDPKTLERVKEKEHKTTRTKEEKDRDDLIKQMNVEFKRLADGIVIYMNETKKKGSKKIEQIKKIPKEVINKYLSENGELFTNHIEWQLIVHYESLIKEEELMLKEIEDYLENFPIWREYMKKVPGIGPSLAGMMISYIDIVKADTVSKLQSYFGDDTVADPNNPDKRYGRSSNAISLVDRPYLDKDGKLQTKKSLKYNPKLKAKANGVMSGTLMMGNKYYRKIYNDYKFRISNDPEKKKKIINSKGKEVLEFPPARLSAMGRRYMVKMFIKNLWISWRYLEGLPLNAPYEERKLNLDTSAHVDPWGLIKNPKFVNLNIAA